jgi:hypothetical protein
MTKTQAVLCDIDGTIALMGKGDPTRRGPYDWARVGEDDPCAPVLDLVRILAQHFTVLFVSGRDEVCRPETLKWLTDHGVLDLPDDGTLFMRHHKDNRRDDIVKREIYERDIAPHFDVAYVLDDRNQVVAMWRSLGLTVLQVADGDF